ncbi:HYC_CC_PP family protein [Rudanella lutea]|uniref:HYC_CC_PP family protein n=1 Tax=Rudanella lutea TaxID=451374 RepID=UPI00037621CD|nr:hypothetical protein [Rudanella lutea]
MKRQLFRIVNVLMAVVVLLSSTGFGLVEHSCQMRGKKISLVGTEKTGCVGCPTAKAQPASAQPVVKKADCCQEEQRYEKVDIGSSLSQLVAKFFKIMAEAVVTSVTTLVTALLNWMFSQDESVVIHAPNAPPAAHGRQLLVLVQSFLI